MKALITGWLATVALVIAEPAIRVTSPGGDGAVELAPLATIPIGERIAGIEPMADGRAVVLATVTMPALHVVRLDEPTDLGRIPLNAAVPYAANGDAVFVYAPDSQRLTRHPLPDLRPEVSVPMEDPGTLVQLSAAVSSSTSPLWVSHGRTLRALDPKTLGPAGIGLPLSGTEPRGISLETQSGILVSPDGSALGGSGFVARVDGRGFWRGTAPSRASLDGVHLAADGLHFVNHGCFRSLADSTPVEPTRSHGGRMALHGLRWWAPVGRTDDKLSIRSGSTDRALLELTSADVDWGRVFISFEHQRLAVVDASHKALRIYPFDFDGLAVELEAPSWIDVHGAMVVFNNRPMTLRVGTSRVRGRVKLVSAPEDVKLEDGKLTWKPPKVPKESVFRMVVEDDLDAVQSFEVLVLPTDLPDDRQSRE